MSAGSLFPVPYTRPMGRRLVELVWVILVVGCAMFWWSARRPEPLPAPAPSATEAATALPVGAAFELPALEGDRAVHAVGQGPLLMLLTSPGCAGCRDRAPLDKEVHQIAKDHGIPVWSLLVYTDEATARRFVEETSQPADRHLLDADAKVAVSTYGGSDASCWVLLNRKGEIVYRGNDVKGLWEALDYWMGAMER